MNGSKPKEVKNVINWRLAAWAKKEKAVEEVEGKGEARGRGNTSADGKPSSLISIASLESKLKELIEESGARKEKEGREGEEELSLSIASERLQIILIFLCEGAIPNRKMPMSGVRGGVGARGELII